MVNRSLWITLFQMIVPTHFLVLSSIEDAIFYFTPKGIFWVVDRPIPFSMPQRALDFIKFGDET